MNPVHSNLNKQLSVNHWDVQFVYRQVSQGSADSASLMLAMGTAHPTQRNVIWLPANIARQIRYLLIHILNKFY